MSVSVDTLKIFLCVGRWSTSYLRHPGFGVLHSVRKFRGGGYLLAIQGCPDLSGSPGPKVRVETSFWLFSSKSCPTDGGYDLFNSLFSVYHLPL